MTLRTGLWVGAMGLVAGSAIGEPVDASGSETTAAGPRVATTSSVPLVESDIDEDFEDADFGADLDGYMGWSDPAGAFGIFFPFVPDPSLDLRSPFLQSGLASATTPVLGAALLGSARADVVVVTPGDGSPFVRVLNTETGSRVTTVALLPDGTIAAEDLIDAQAPFGGTQFVDTGRDWVEDENLTIRVGTVDDQTATVSIDGLPALLVSNIGGAQTGDGGFNRLEVGQADFGDGSASGSTAFGFDNVLTNRVRGGPGACAADLDGDGMVGASDLGTLISAWGPCP